MIVFNSIPECLRLWTINKMTFVRDFNEAIDKYLKVAEDKKLPMLVFTFSD